MVMIVKDVIMKLVHQ